MMRHTTQCSIRAERIDFQPFHLSSNLRLLYVLEGSLNLRFACGEHLLHTGEIEILNIDEPVQMKKLHEDNLILLFEFDGTRAKQFNSAISRGIYNCNSTLFYTSRTLPVDQRILKRELRLIYRYYLNDGDDFLIDKTMEEIVLFICDRCHDLKNMFRNTPRDDHRGERFLRVYTYMLENCDKKINLKKLAEQEFMSPQYLSKEFNDKLGINFKDTLEYFRVIQSVRYLITGSMAVTQICQRCGFSALRYFYKHFSFYLNCTPLEFRGVYLSDPERIMSFPVNHSRIESLFQTFEAQEEPWIEREESQCDPEQIWELALTQAEQARSFGSQSRLSIISIYKKEDRTRLTRFLSESLCEENPAVYTQIILVFCMEGFSGWTEEATAKLAHTAAAAERFCQTAEKQGLLTVESVCPENSREEIAELLGMQDHLTPIILVAAGRSGFTEAFAQQVLSGT